MAKTAPAWAFRARFRSRAYGWKSSRLACERLKQAVSEILKEARRDPAEGVEGSLLLMERIWPAFQGVDTSSGALGAAVNWALDQLIPLIRDAPATAATRRRWMVRLWEAAMDDGVDYLSPVLDRWGELCGSAEEAARWADALSVLLRKNWADPQGHGYFRGTHACLSCLFATQRFDELFALLELAPYPSWHQRRYGVEALLAQGRPDEAIEYAEASRGLNQPGRSIDRKCEEILLAQGRFDDAYARYALTANETNTGLATFRLIKEKYPRMDRRRILEDLANSTGDPGRFFAAAKDEGLLELALKLAQEGRTDPRTLSRAARDLVDRDARFCVTVGLLAVNRFLDGYGYEVAATDVAEAWDHTAAAALRVGALEQVRDAVLRRTAGARAGSMEWMLQRHILRTDGSVLPN